MAKKTDDTNIIDLAAIEREDERLGVLLKLLLSLPRPLPGPVAIRMLGDLRKAEGHIRQSAIDRRRAAEQRERDAKHAATLEPARAELAAHAENIKAAGEMDTRPIDVDRLADHAARAEVNIKAALEMAGLDESSPAVQAWTAIRQRRKQSSRVIPFSPANVKR